MSSAAIDKLDFDQHRQFFHGHDSPDNVSRTPSLLDNVVLKQQHDRRRRLRYQISKYGSLAIAVFCSFCAGSIITFSLYGPLFISRLRYSQFQVNAVSASAAVTQYLSLPLFGLLCDRYSPRPVCLASSVLFGVGYLFAALTYQHSSVQESGWPPAVMMAAFALIGCGTPAIIISSIVTCAKNFAKSTYKGLAMALPITAFGIGGLALSQVGSRLLHEPGEGGKRGDVDVYRYFLFLMGLLFAAGLVGAIGLVVVNEEELISEAAENLEPSGLLDCRQPLLGDFSRPHDRAVESTTTYEPISRPHSPSPSKSSGKTRRTSIRQKKTIVLNTATRQFLTDPTMWLFAMGFFLVLGPLETFINNFGTIIPALDPPSGNNPSNSKNSVATNVSVVAVASTLARVLASTLSDLFAPSSSLAGQSPRFTISRLSVLILFILLLGTAQFLLASSLIQHYPFLFPLISALVGASYGSSFSLCPVIIAVVWGSENFGTNYGIVAAMPAIAIAIWSAIYSAVYETVTRNKGEFCRGVRCYGATFWGMGVCSLIAVALWSATWRRWRRNGILV